jgi:hypothetical protein
MIMSHSKLISYIIIALSFVLAVYLDDKTVWLASLPFVVTLMSIKTYIASK